MKSSNPLTQINIKPQNDKKYQKAIKQISKLISINRTIKKQLIVLQNKYDNLQSSYLILEQKNATLSTQDSFQFQHKRQQLNLKTTQSYSPQNIESNKKTQMSNTLNIKNWNKNNFYPTSSIPNKQLQNTGTISQYIQYKKIIQQLSAKIQDQSNYIHQLENQLENKIQQNLQIYQKCQEFKSLNLNHNTVIFKLKQQQSILENQLHRAEQFIHKLRKNNQIINKKLVIYQQFVNNNKQNYHQLLSQNTNNNFSLFWEGKDRYHANYCVTQGDAKSYDTSKKQSEKKIKDLEQQIQKLQQKKNKYKNQINKLKQDLIIKQNNLKHINQFVYKQQAFIQQFIQHHHQQIDQLSPNNVKNNKTDRVKMTSNPHIYQQNISSSYHHSLVHQENNSKKQQQQYHPHTSREPLQHQKHDHLFKKTQKNAQNIHTVQSEEYKITEKQLKQFGQTLTRNSKHALVQKNFCLRN